MRLEHDLEMLERCRRVAAASADPSTKTGAIITAPSGAILADGYNRFPAGMAETPERMADRDDKLSRIIHCEIVALMAVGRLPPGCSLYTTPFMSCDRCAVVMLDAGIRRFVTYRAAADKLERWGAAFERVRGYITECGGTLLEYEAPGC